MRSVSVAWMSSGCYPQAESNLWTRNRVCARSIRGLLWCFSSSSLPISELDIRRILVELLVRAFLFLRNARLDSSGFGIYNG